MKKDQKTLLYEALVKMQEMSGDSFYRITEITRRRIAKGLLYEDVSLEDFDKIRNYISESHNWNINDFNTKDEIVAEIDRLRAAKNRDLPSIAYENIDRNINTLNDKLAALNKQIVSTKTEVPTSFAESCKLLESVLDPINKIRCSDIFDKNDKMLQNVRKFITDIIDKFKEHVNFPLNIRNIYMIGSSTGYQYSLTSDVDIEIELGITDDQKWELLPIVPKGTLLPGTQRPINLFILSKDESYNFDKAENVYDLVRDKWLKKTGKKNVDIPYQYIKDLSTFFMNGCDLAISNFERDVRELDEYINLNPNTQEISIKEKFEAIDRKLVDVKNDVDQIKMAHHVIFAFENEGYEGKPFKISVQGLNDPDPRYSVNNLIYKMLDRHGYNDKMKNILKTGLAKVNDVEKYIADNKKKSLHEARNTYYHTCPKCGANLDPGERCDCEREEAERKKKDSEDHDKIAAKAIKPTTRRDQHPRQLEIDFDSIPSKVSESIDVKKEYDGKSLEVELDADLDLNDGKEHTPTKEQVKDVDITGEVWVTEKCSPKHLYDIKVIGKESERTEKINGKMFKVPVWDYEKIEGIRESEVQDGDEKLLESTQKYDPPYNAKQIKDNYGDETYNRLVKDPAHKWRMDTGIELIHKEPSKEELERIWKNWNLMSDTDKRKSDEKSISLFGMNNSAHYKKLIKESELLDEGLLSKENIEINLDKWDNNNNILFITGLSGSGKTTLSKKIAKEHNAVVFDLDKFFITRYPIEKYALKIQEWRKEYPKANALIDMFDTFVKQNINIGWSDKYKIGSEEFISEIKNLSKISFDFTKHVSNKLKGKYIFEGTQIYKDFDSEFLKDKPIIIVGTGYLRSIIWRIKRSGDIKNIKNIFSMLKDARKEDIILDLKKKDLKESENLDEGIPNKIYSLFGAIAYRISKLDDNVDLLKSGRITIEKVYRDDISFFEYVKTSALKHAKSFSDEGNEKMSTIYSILAYKVNKLRDSLIENFKKAKDTDDKRLVLINVQNKIDMLVDWIEGKKESIELELLDEQINRNTILDKARDIMEKMNNIQYGSVYANGKISKRDSNDWYDDSNKFCPR